MTIEKGQVFTPGGDVRIHRKVAELLRRDVHGRDEP